MSSKPKILMPTDEEDAAINRGIAEDPDTVEVSAEQMRAMQPWRGADVDGPCSPTEEVRRKCWQIGSNTG